MRKTQMLVLFNSLLALFARLCLLIPGSCADVRLYPRNHSKNLGTRLDSTHTPIDRYRVTVLQVLSNPHSRN